MSGNGYPFVTRRQIIERLDTDPAFVRECVSILHRRFVDRDILSPPAGWMVSHRKAGEDVYTKLSSDTANAGDVTVAAKLAKRYAKQLCKVFRDEQLAENPQLAGAAAVFGVRPAVDDDRDNGDDPYAELDDERDEPAAQDTAGDQAGTPASTATIADDPTSLPEEVDQPVQNVRRRGRPKGSKNRPKEDRVKPRGKRGKRG